MSKKPKKVYVVTAGTYSDYHIEAVFEDKSLAEAHAAQLEGYDSGRVEDYTVTTEQPRKVMVYAAASKDGEDLTFWSFDKWDYELYEVGLGGRKKVSIQQVKAPAGYFIRGWSLDHKAVRKAVADRRAEYLAKLEGVA